MIAQAVKIRVGSFTTVPADYVDELVLQMKAAGLALLRTEAESNSPGVHVDADAVGYTVEGGQLPIVHVAWIGLPGIVHLYGGPRDGGTEDLGNRYPGSVVVDWHGNPTSYVFVGIETTNNRRVFFHTAREEPKP